MQCTVHPRSATSAMGAASTCLTDTEEMNYEEGVKNNSIKHSQAATTAAKKILNCMVEEIELVSRTLQGGITG